MRKRLMVFSVFAAIFCSLHVWLFMASAKAEREDFQHYFGVVYSPNANEQPQVQMQYIVLRGLLKLRSQCKNTVKQKIKIDTAIEELRESIVSGPDRNMMSEGHYMIGLLGERDRLLKEKKEKTALFIRACRLAQKKNFAGACEAAECDGPLSVDVIALANEVREMQQR